MFIFCHANYIVEIIMLLMTFDGWAYIWIMDRVDKDRRKAIYNSEMKTNIWGNRTNEYTLV